MPIKAKTSPLVLFFDCYIITSKTSAYDAYRTKYTAHDELFRSIRMTSTVYRHVNKIDVVKYTLLSYTVVPWDEMIIRVVCEDEDDHADFFEFARRHLPTAKIVNERSATAAEYVKSLTPLKRFGDPWVFFSPNNDHPYIGQPNSFGPLLELAEDLEPLYPSHMIAILFSHFTESQNTVMPDQHDWAWYGGNIATIIGETTLAHVVQSSKFCCDSNRVYRLSALLTQFSNATHTGRCIRLEETGFYLTQAYHDLLICPKEELCRHFDGYGMFLNTTPPLFVPYGFFESDIKIRYGYPDRKEDCVNVNPYEQYSYLGGVADLRCLLTELPAFWKDRITSVDINPAMGQLYRERRNDAFQFTAIKNPYPDNFAITNYKRSAWKILGRKITEFDEKACHAAPLTIPVGQKIAIRAAPSTAVMYFIFSGVVACDADRYRKDDFFAFQGECTFALEAIGGDAQVIQISLPVEGVPSKRHHIWRATNP